MRPSIWDCNKTKAHCMNGHEWSLHSLYHILKLHYIILYLSSCFPSSCTGATSAFLTDLPTYTPYRVLFKTPIQFAIPIPADRPTHQPNEPTNRPGHSLWIYRLHPKPINISPISFPRDHHNNNNNNNNRIRVVFLFKSPVTTDTRSLSRPPSPIPSHVVVDVVFSPYWPLLRRGPASQASEEQEDDARIYDQQR